MEEDMIDERSEIQEFFEGRSIFITGGAGYVGRVLVEQLLRQCPGISEIFVLIRDKKGRDPQSRLQRLFENPIFLKIKQECPEVLEKVHVLSGELSKDDLGLGPEEIETLKRNVSVVINCAASINFTKEIRYLLLHNVVATDNIIKLCQSLPKMEVFVHTSTAYSNMFDSTITEKIIPIDQSITHILDATKNNDGKFLRKLEKFQAKKWRNAYTFTKSVAETLILEKSSGLPFLIVRPPIINAIWKGSLPGYLQIGAAFPDLVLMMLSGYHEVMLAEKSFPCETVPVDIVANTLIIGAWAVATKRIHNPAAVNCISGNTVPLYWGDLTKTCENDCFKCVSPNMIRPARVRSVSNAFVYFFLATIFHLLPALFVDAYSLLKGREARLFKTYLYTTREMYVVGIFTTNLWKFKSDNFELLRTLLNRKDEKLFYIDFTGYNFKFLMDTAHVNKFMRFETDDVTAKFKKFAAGTRFAIIMDALKVVSVLIILLVLWLFAKLLLYIFNSIY